MQLLIIVKRVRPKRVSIACWHDVMLQSCRCTQILWLTNFFQNCVPGDKTAHFVTRETAPMYLQVVNVRLGSEGPTA